LTDESDFEQAPQSAAAVGVKDGRSYLVQAAVLVGVVAITVIITLWASRDAERVGVEILIPTPVPVTFQVSGEVVRPGVYSLDGEPRVNDAIDAAGGLTADADARRLNLALHVRDGGKIIVHSLISGSVDSGAVDGSSNETAGADSGGLPSGSSSLADDGSSSGLIDLNTASKDQLISLPGVGEFRADSIIEWRTNNLINSTSDLLAISGIGPATVDSIRDYVTQP
jgi:competence protein ComEA